MPAVPFLSSLARLRWKSVAGPGSEPGSLLPSRRRAPWALLTGVVLFFGLQLLLGLAAEVYPRIRDPLYGDKFVKLKRRLPKSGEPARTVVMLGSSRTGLAFDGKRVEAALSNPERPTVAFNYGIPASGPVTHLVYLKRMLKSGVRPSLLVLEILPSMIGDMPGAPLEQNWFYADRLTHSELDTVIRHGFPANQVRERWGKSIALSWYTLRFQVLTRIIPSWLPWQVRFDWSRGADDCGWGTVINQTMSPEELAKAEARAQQEYGPVLSTLNPGGPAASALRELLTVCKDEGIPVRIVLMPEGSKFRAMYPPVVQERLNSFLQGITTEFGLPPVIDARLWLSDDCFYDGHHMFARGAYEFTDRLTREVIAPLLTANSSR